MKKVFIILGCVLGVLILAGVIGFCVVYAKGTALEKESKAYVDEVTPKILANLTKENLFQYSSDELKNVGTPEEFDKIFRMFARLGKYKEYKGANGQANISITTERGKQITGIYEAKAEFENGPATIKIITIKRCDNWQIINFVINSMALASE